MLELFWPVSTVFLTVIIFHVVPLAYLKQLIFYGYISGFLFAFLQNFFLVNVLKWWTYHRLFIQLGGIPLDVLVFWLFASILFGYLILTSIINRVILFTTLSLAYTLAVQILVWLGYLSFMGGWNIILTFLQSFISHAIFYGLFIWLVPSELKSKIEGET